VDNSDPIVRRLGRFESAQLDCDDLRSDLFFSGPLLAPLVVGWVVIESDEPLQVTVIQSSVGEGGDSSVSTTVIEGQELARVRASRGQELVEICHRPPGNPDNRHTIVIESSAVPVHIQHGDRRGECDEDERDDDD
jgi:hypothetical protein